MHEWVAEASGKITVLLGAGASVPAGLPMSKDLTKIVFDTLDERSREPRTWEFVRAHVDQDAIDVEQLWRSLDDLRHVLVEQSTWAGLLNVPDIVTAKSIETAQFNILDVAVASLRNHSVNAPTAYLDSLVRADIVGIATLNFDTLVETAAEACGALVATGADDWEGAFKWPIPRDATPLLKLHGSLDWHSVVLGAGRSRVVDSRRCRVRRSSVSTGAGSSPTCASAWRTSSPRMGRCPHCSARSPSSSKTALL